MWEVFNELIGSEMAYNTPSHSLLANTQSSQRLGNRVQLKSQKEKENKCFGEQLTVSVLKIFF